MLILASLSWVTATGLFVSILPRLVVRVRNAPSYQDISARLLLVRSDDDDNEDEGDHGLEALDQSVTIDEVAADVSDLDGND